MKIKGEVFKNALLTNLLLKAIVDSVCFHFKLFSLFKFDWRHWETFVPLIKWDRVHFFSYDLGFVLRQSIAKLHSLRNLSICFTELNPDNAILVPRPFIFFIYSVKGQWPVPPLLQSVIFKCWEITTILWKFH